MNPSHRRAWQALELGALWRLRQPVQPVVADAVEVQARGTVAAASPAVDLASDAGRAAAIDRMDWAQLRATVGACRACGLCETRTQTVFGAGGERAQWMLVGEAPGQEEDARGEPFVGQAGRLLDNMLAAIGLDRAADVYIANVLKCRPPRNRDPQPEEVAHCEPFLQRQVALLGPKLILVMGRFAAQSLLRTDASIASLRGRLHRYEAGGLSVPVVVTYHPAYLLRNLEDKAKSWADLCFALRCAGEGG
jgi:DNA polymerase